MPTLEGDPVIRRAWRNRGETGRIHYIANGGDRDRHLYVDEGHPLYEVLAEALSARGYHGPSYPGRGDVPPVEE